MPEKKEIWHLYLLALGLQVQVWYEHRCSSSASTPRKIVEVILRGVSNKYFVIASPDEIGAKQSVLLQPLPFLRGD